MGVFLAKLPRALVKRALNRFEHVANGTFQALLRCVLLLPVVAARQHDLISFQVLRPHLDAKRNAPLFPVIEFPARTVLVAVIHFESDTSRLEPKREFADGFHDALALFRLSEYRYDDNLRRCKARWNDDPVIIAVRHDQRADHACGKAPACGVDELACSFLCLKRHIKSLRKILPQVM